MRNRMPLVLKSAMLVVCFALITALPAQMKAATPDSPADGDWQGTLNFQGGSLTIVLHIKVGGTSTADSPDQNANGMPATVSVNGSDLSFSIPSVRASFSGTIRGSKISGTFSQNGADLPLTLTKQ